MKTLIRSLSVLASVGVVGALGASLLADPPKPGPAASLPQAATKETPPAKPEKPAAPPQITPVRVTDNKAATRTAVDPKPLSAAVKKGLEYLAKNQQEDGGWNQGGGWRTSLDPKAGGRIEGKNVQDPSDVGNTCFALLALFRSGSTTTEGPYKANILKGLQFILTRVEKADQNSLYVTDVRNTQLQSKIGQYVDTFMVNLVLAEMRGQGGSEEKRLTAALGKTMNKIVNHQDAKGGFANNRGWAPTLSVGIANKSLVRAKQNGVVIDQKVLDRALAQSQVAAAGRGGPESRAPGVGGIALAGRPAPALSGPGGSFTGRGGAVGGFGGMMGGMAGDAGVRLYSLGQGGGNSQDLVNSLRVDGKKAEKILKDAKATLGDKDKARKTIKALAKAEAENEKVQGQLAKTVRDDRFVAGFGSNGGEEFLSFLNISEALLVKGGKDWTDWDAKMTAGLQKAQDGNGSWAGQHCITGKTFCTSAALLVLMADRTRFPVDAFKASAKPEGKK